MKTLTELATLWAAYNSLSGKASPKQVERICKQFRLQEATLARMLNERGISTD
jgi:hypothetical protein